MKAIIGVILFSVGHAITDGVTYIDPAFGMAGIGMGLLLIIDWRIGK